MSGPIWKMPALRFAIAPTSRSISCQSAIRREAAIAHLDAGAPMPARAAAERVPGDLRVPMGVAVDKARRDDQPVGIDDPLRRRMDAADLDDPAAAEADIGAVARHPRAVHDG